MRRILFAAALLSVPCWAAPGQSMPGMDMGQHEHPKPDSPSKKPPPSPMNIAKPQRGDAPTKGAAEPATPQQGNGATSISRPMQTLQEQENIPFHSGTEDPAPDLLSDITRQAPMGLDEFLAMAEKNNPTLAQARANITRSEQQGRQAGLPPNPMIGYSSDHIRGGSYGGGEQGGYIQQEFVLGGKLRLRRDIYRQETSSNQTALEEQTYRVRSTVQQAFYDALTFQALVLAHQNLLRVALDAGETAHRLENLGQADATDVLQAEIETEEAKIQFTHAQRDYLQSFHILAAVVGAQHLVVSPLRGDLEQPPLIDVEQQVSTILAHSPTLHRVQQEVAVAEAEVKSARREAVPNLTLRAGEYYSGEFAGGSGKAAGPESFVEAGINLPLWNRNQGNIGSAKAELGRALQEVARVSLDLKRQAEPLAQRYLSARFEAERYRTQLLPRSQRVYDLYLMKYQQMAAAYPQVLNAQKMLFQRHIIYIHALHEQWKNAIALQNYTLTGGLDQPASASRNTTAINPPTGGGSQ